MAKSDVMAVTHKEKKPPKVVSHLEIHPNMKSGHDVHIVHTHPFDHPPIVKSFEGPHEEVGELPKGHILHHVAQQLGIGMGAEVGAQEEGGEQSISEKEGEKL